MASGKMSSNQTILEILRDKNGQKRRKALKNLFSELSGDSNTVEVFSLALGREHAWQEKQIHVLRDLRTLLCSSRHDLPKVVGMDVNRLGAVLVSSGVVSFLVRMLQVELPDRPDAATAAAAAAATSNGSGGKVEMYRDWPLSYHLSATLLGHLSTVSADDKASMQELFDQEAVETLIHHLNDNKLQYVTGSFAACTALLHFCNASHEACERIVFAGGLALLGKFVFRDTPQQWVAKHCKGKMKPCEVTYVLELMEEKLSGKYGKGRPVYAYTGMGMAEKQRIAYQKLLDLSQCAQVDATKVLARIAQVSDRHRIAIWRCKFAQRAILKWLESPIITKNDLRMTIAVAKVLALLCRKEEIALRIHTNTDIVDILETGVSLPYKEGVLAFMEAATVAVKHGGLIRVDICESEVILPVVLAAVWSYCPDLQRSAFTLLIAIASSIDGAPYALKAGANAEFIHLFRNFYRSVSGTADLAAQLKKAMVRYCSSDWKANERKFNSQDVQLNSSTALALKYRGNEDFAQRKFEDAYRNYHTAIICCPPFNTKCLIPDVETLRLPPWDVLQFSEWCTPSMIYSNMAQCMLKLHSANEAISHCIDALGRCMQGTEPTSEAVKMRVKIAYRRARAYLSAERYHLALNDAAYCYLHSTDKEDNVTTLFREALLRYRDDLGHEAVRVCGVCGAGAGERLKRCAECTECYCSRECQRKDWDNGHKKLCEAIRDPYSVCDCM